MIQQYDVVALLEDLPAENLYRGQVGTVIEIYDPSAYEVEFFNRENGITYAMCVLRPEQLMKLYFERIDKVNMS